MIYRLLTETADKNRRLDLYLAEKTLLSRTAIRKMIDLGGAHINGRRVRKCGTPLKAGQQIELHQDKQPLVPFRLQQHHILFQDRYIIVINKPAGIETQPTPARYKGTLHAALQSFLQEQGVQKPTTGMHQRLDRDTSGLLLFSLHPTAHKNIAEQMQRRNIHRHYLALTAGSLTPLAATIRSNLARRRRNNQMISVEKGGKEAITHYTTKAIFTIKGERCSLLLINLETGRSHQIRIHLAEQGHPLLGDQLYGGAITHHDKEYHRQCLHSHRLIFNHPVTKEKMEFALPPPEEILP